MEPEIVIANSDRKGSYPEVRSPRLYLWCQVENRSPQPPPVPPRSPQRALLSADRARLGVCLTDDAARSAVERLRLVAPAHRAPG